MTTGGVRGASAAPTLELVYEGSVVLVQAEVVIVGRTPKCTVRVIHPLVSREHCRLEPRADGLFVVDLDSVNGTWLNGERVTERTPARGDDRIGLGRDGAVLVVRRALVGGVDVSRMPREEDVHTMVAGDARAAGAVARVEVAAEALPRIPVADEVPTGGVAAPRIVSSIQTAEAAPGADSPPTQEMSAPAAPAPAPEAAAARPGRRGFAPGFAVGFALGLAAIAALLTLTHALDPIRPSSGSAENR